MATDAQLELAQKTGIVVKESDVGRSRWMDVARNISCAEGLAVDEGKVIDLARLDRLITETRFHVWRRYLNQLLFRNR